MYSSFHNMYLINFSKTPNLQGFQKYLYQNKVIFHFHFLMKILKLSHMLVKVGDALTQSWNYRHVSMSIDYPEFAQLELTPPSFVL